MNASEIAAGLRERVAGKVMLDAPLAPFTTFRVGGPADVLLEAESSDDLRVLAEVVGGDDVPVAIVGRGSNLLVSDEGFRGVAVRLGRGFREHERTDAGLVLGGGVHLPAAARLTARLGLGGFEFAAEIPATFGGAVTMNAGAHGRSMADVLVWAEVVSLRDATLRTVAVDDLDYGYRRSNLGPADVVTRGEIRLDPAEPDEVASAISSFLRWRRENQPPGRSAGSVFKNPTGESAGRLIDEAGGKGLVQGSAQVSPVHANFIVVEPGGKASDVWSLLWRVHAMVKERAGVDLEPEVRFLGSFDEAHVQG